ncbi:MAG: hypothetical protein GY801_19140 [bacterium]|nr:hypothetical protein [bacterium]
MVFFGFLIVGIAIDSALYNVSLLLFGQNTYGTVNRQEEEWTRVKVQAETQSRSAVYEDRLVYFAIVEIKVDEGRFEIRASTAGGVPRYPTGSEVEVLYFSRRPEEGRITHEVQSPWGEFFLAFFGVVMIGLACFVMFIQGAWSVPERIRTWFKKQIEKRFSDTGVAERFAAREDSSQFAVGAIVKDDENEKYLLVRTVKSLERQTASASDSGEWNFLKGGLLSPQESRRSALLNVLQGKTGSVYYTIIEEFEETLMQKIAQGENSPSITQEITMYLVTYTGDGADFSPQDKAVEQLDFFLPEEALERISTKESQAFFEKYVVNRLAKEKNPDVV